MRIQSADLEIQRVPFARPFAFKGSAFHEKWNMLARLENDAGHKVIGVGGLAVLWSDAAVFAAHTEVGGNLLQSALLERALQIVKGRSFEHPCDVFDYVIDEIHDYAQVITGNPCVRRTFALIAMVALDNAAWLLHAAEGNSRSFDDMLPAACRGRLAHRQSHVALAPAVGYNLPDDELQSLLDGGSYVLKIKIGQPGDEGEMVSGDIRRLDHIHAVARGHTSEMTDAGHVLYYLDANGRYGAKQSMERLLDHADKQGYLDCIILIEEPFQKPDETDVHGLPACFAGDESVETLNDVSVRAEQGYGAMAIKPAGKTLTLSLRVIESADALGLNCFVADNACVPLLVEWNKNVAARLPAFPGLRGGLIESNGPENYADWASMLNDYPIANAGWLRPNNGSFVLDSEYFDSAGGIFERFPNYERMFRQGNSE